MIWLQGKYHTRFCKRFAGFYIEQASPLCIIYNSFITSCDEISLTATAFFKDISSHELPVEKRSLSFAMTLNKRSEDALFTGLASTLKVRKNGQQKTCNLFCNVAAKRVEKRCYAIYHPCLNLLTT